MESTVPCGIVRNGLRQGQESEPIASYCISPAPWYRSGTVPVHCEWTLSPYTSDPEQIVRLTAKHGPMDERWQSSISLTQKSIMVWSSWDSSRIPHRRSIICNYKSIIVIEASREIFIGRSLESSQWSLLVFCPKILGCGRDLQIDSFSHLVKLSLPNSIHLWLNILPHLH